MWHWLKERRRKRLRFAPFPSEWRVILQQRFSMFSRLPEEDQRELEGHIQVFLKEKRFEGCGGLSITDEIRVVIAAQACLLLLHRDTDYYPGLQAILVYPNAYFAKTAERSKYGFVTEGHSARLGESWQDGAVVLSWDSASGGAADIGDGHNVVFHEFAHQLDQEDGQADGVPVLAAEDSFLKRRGKYITWARVLSAEYRRLQHLVQEGKETVMDSYGASNTAEFFAVATECFFEKPRQMKRKHPKLYEELKQFYRQDPSEWISSVPPN